MKFLEELTPTNIASIITGVFALIGLLNKKIRSFVFRQLTSLRNKSEIIRDTSVATDETIERLSSRVNSTYQDLLKLYDENTMTQKENFNLKNKVNKLESEKQNLKDNKCKNNCFDV